MPTWPSPVLSSGFTYVSDTAPKAPEEGETWYDTSTSEAKVYDGASWLKLTVTDHAELGNVSAGQHRSDANVRSTVDGVVDADTVDGQHASDLGAPSSTQTGGAVGSAWKSISWGEEKICDGISWSGEQSDITTGTTDFTVTVNTLSDSYSWSTSIGVGESDSWSRSFPPELVVSANLSVSGDGNGSLDQLRVRSMVPHQHNI